MRILRHRIVLLAVVVLILVIPYTLLLAVHFINTHIEQTIEYKEEAPVSVTVNVRKAMYLGSSYDVAVTLTVVSRFFNPEMFEETASYKEYAQKVLAKARCKLDAPDYSVVETKPKTEREHATVIDQRGMYTEYIWDCGFVVSPKVSGRPMLLVGVTDISGFESAKTYGPQTLFVSLPSKLHDLHLAVNVPVDERLSLTTISAPLAIAVALAGLFIKGKDDADDDPTLRLLKQNRRGTRR